MMLNVEFLSASDPTSTPEQLISFACSILPQIGIPLNGEQLNMFTQILPSVFSRMHLSFSVLVLALRYMKLSQVSSSYSTTTTSTYGVYSLFVASLMSASKFLDDNTFTNKSWSIVSHIPIMALNAMELSFLTSIQFNLHTSNDQYTNWLSELISISSNIQQQQQQHQQQERVVLPSVKSLILSTSNTNEKKVKKTSTRKTIKRPTPISTTIMTSTMEILSSPQEDYEFLYSYEALNNNNNNKKRGLENYSTQNSRSSKLTNYNNIIFHSHSQLFY